MTAPAITPEMLADAEAFAAMAAEPLHEDLAAYFEEATPGLGWPAVRHPLVYEIPFFNAGMTNRRYEAKRAELAAAEERGDWAACVWIHQRPHRTEALIEYVVGTDEWGAPRSLADCSDEVRELAADVWRDSENLHQHEDEWEAMFEGVTSERPFTDDPEGWAALPETLTVYRGDCEDGGWSWSLDEKVARFFANRFDAGHALVTGTVAKADVFGYLSQRSESEVLIRHGAVQIEE